MAAFRLRPALTAAWTGVAIAVYVLISLPNPATRTRADVDAIVVHALFLAWAGAGGRRALGGARRARPADPRRRRRARPAGGPGATAEERERQRLAELLHDDAIQNLLLARQELRDHHRRHDEDSYQRADAALAETVDQLRGEIFELHPYVLDHAGLRAALTAHAESAARRAGARAVVEVDEQTLAEGEQRLVLSLARELLSNAARHSGASTIRLRLTCDPDAIVLVVTDDGRGFAPERRAEALAEGHIGIATSAERAAAAGGTFESPPRPGPGRRSPSGCRETTGPPRSPIEPRAAHPHGGRPRHGHATTPAPPLAHQRHDRIEITNARHRHPHRTPSDITAPRAAERRAAPGCCASSSPTTIPSIATASCAP